MQLAELTTYLDAYLRTAEVTDWSGAVNGLQLENGGAVTQIGVAVDATWPVIEKAVAAGVDFLIVHHVSPKIGPCLSY